VIGSLVAAMATGDLDSVITLRQTSSRLRRCGTILGRPRNPAHTNGVEHFLVIPVRRRSRTPACFPGYFGCDTLASPNRRHRSAFCLSVIVQVGGDSAGMGVDPLSPVPWSLTRRGVRRRR
jgi:hypothetical protein